MRVINMKEASQILDCSIREAERMFDAGKIRGWRTSVYRERMTTVEEVERFKQQIEEPKQ